MKFFRKGISTIVLSSKLLLALGIGLPFCSFQGIYASPQKELSELSKKADLTVRDINSAINNLEQDRTLGSQSSYINILKNLNINSTNPEMVDAIKRAFQKAADLINGTFSKSEPGRAQPFYKNKDFIFNTLEQINNKVATSRTTSSKATTKSFSAPIKTQAHQPTVDTDLEKAKQASIKTAKEDDERRAKALEAQKLAEEKATLQAKKLKKIASDKIASKKPLNDARKKAAENRNNSKEKAAQTTSTSSALKTVAKVAIPVAIAAGAGLATKALYDKATAPAIPAAPIEVKKNVIEVVAENQPIEQDSDLIGALESGYYEKANNEEISEDAITYNPGIFAKAKNKIANLFKFNIKASKGLTTNDDDQSIIGALEEGKDYGTEENEFVKKDEATSSNSSSSTDIIPVEKSETVKPKTTAATKAKLKQILIKTLKLGGYASIIGLACWLYMHPEMQQMIIEAAQELVATLGSKTATTTCPMLPDGVTAQDICNSPYSQLPGEYGMDCSTLAPVTPAPVTTDVSWICRIRGTLDPIFSLGGLLPTKPCH